jgi:haloalkane dehalogenase
MADKQYATINGLRMAYLDEGEGDPIVFLHGNPTSSFLWRFIWPHVADLGRVIVPDLIGMGDSDKLPGSGPTSYGFFEHKEYLWALLDHLGVTEDVTLVIHDWGSGLGFHWAHEHPDAVKAIMYMEAIVTPLDSWEHWPEAARGIFQGMRSEAGEVIVLEKNTFVERILPASIIRDLTEEEMAEYRRPFLNPGEDRRPTLTWPRQIPIEGSPADVHDAVLAYGEWMAGNEIPKFFVNAQPGTVLIGPQRDFCRTWPNQREITVPGIHFIQEDAGDDIGHALRSWLQELD